MLLGPDLLDMQRTFPEEFVNCYGLQHFNSSDFDSRLSFCLEKKEQKRNKKQKKKAFVDILLCCIFYFLFSSPVPWSK